MSHQPDRAGVLILPKEVSISTSTALPGTLLRVPAGTRSTSRRIPLKRVLIPAIVPACQKCDHFHHWKNHPGTFAWYQHKSGLNSQAKIPTFSSFPCSWPGPGGSQEVGRIIIKYVNYDSLTINKLSHLLKNGIVISTYAGFHPVLPPFLACFIPTLSQIRPFLGSIIPMSVFEDCAR